MRRAIAVGAVLAALAIATLPAHAATPSGGTLSKPGQILSWTGSFSATTLEARCDVVDVCEHFKLKVAMGDGARIKVLLPPPNPVTDLDLYVYDPSGVEVGESGNLPGEAESVTFTHKGKFRNKAYDVEIVPYLVVPQLVTYKATASVLKYVR